MSALVERQPPGYGCRGFWLIPVFIASYVLVDFFRRFLGGSQVPLLAVDLILLCCLLTIAAQNRRTAVSVLAEYPFLWCGVVVFCVYCFVLGAATCEHTIPTLLAIRSYTLPLLFCLVGCIIGASAHRGQLISFEKHLRIILAICITVSGIQILLLDGMEGPLRDAFLPMEHAVHSFGTEAVSLHSSFFASSKRFGRFILVAVVTSLFIRRYLQCGPGVMPLLGLVGTVISGSREAAFIMLAISLVCYLPHIRRHAVASTAVVAAIVATLAALLSVEGVAMRLSFLAGESEDYAYRIQMLLPVFYPSTIDANLLLGFGPGTYGQETLLVPAVAERAESLCDSRFLRLGFFSGAYNFQDSGLTKLVLDLGLFGLALLSLPLSVFWAWGIQKRDALFLFWLVAVSVLVLKVHATISDLGFTVFSALSLTLCMALANRHGNERGPTACALRGTQP